MNWMLCDESYKNSSSIRPLVFECSDDLNNFQNQTSLKEAYFNELHRSGNKPEMLEMVAQKDPIAIALNTVSNTRGNL